MVREQIYSQLNQYSIALVLHYNLFTDKFRGDIPWWRVDPRKNTETEQSKSKQPKEDFDVEESMFQNLGRYHHHDHVRNHRTDSGRASSSEQILNRKRRSANAGEGKMKHSKSEERHVETLVVVDKVLVGFHGRQEVEKYVLTIMNIVSPDFNIYEANT